MHLRRDNHVGRVGNICAIDARMAATIMGADRFNAGAALMAAQSPEAWRDLESAAALLTPNKAALAACRDAAAKAKKEQRCMLVVPAPGS
jgi:hypothetical protein